jgi:hypothetical protein
VAATSQDFDRAKRWGKKFLADWKAGADGGNGRGRSAAPQGPQGDIGYMLARRDSWPAHVQAMGQNRQLHRMVIGTSGNGNLYLTHPRRNLLILGPPRTLKTAGVLIPAILGHPGPVVSTSTKADVLRATGLVRAMADISEQGSAENSAYFRTKAGVLIAALLHGAALGDKPLVLWRIFAQWTLPSTKEIAQW